MTRSRIWTLGTAVVVVMVLAAGWFLLVSPTRADAADIQAQTVSQEQANAQLALKIETLKVQAQDLPAQEAKLEKFRQKVPAQPALPGFIRSLSDIASKSNVVLVSMAPNTPTALTVAVPVAPTATNEDGTPIEGGGVTLDTAPASNLQYISAQVIIKGGYFNTEQFLNKLEGLNRAFLVTGFDISVDDDVDATAGDVDTNLQIRVFFTSGAAATTGTLPSNAPAN